MHDGLPHRPWVAKYDPGVPARIVYPDHTVLHFLEQAAQKYPDKDCTIFKGFRLSYQAIDTLSDRLAAAFHIQLGIRKGDRVGMFVPNSPQFVAVYWALLKIGAVVVATNPAYTPREIVYQMNDAGVLTMIVVASAYEKIKSLQGQTRITQVVVTAIRETLEPASEVLLELPEDLFPNVELQSGDVALPQLVADHRPEQRPVVSIAPEDTALFQYSGGTTGISKGVVVSHRNMVANAHQFDAWNVTGVEGQEVMFIAIPLYHAYGMVIGLIYGTLLGATFVLVDNPRDVADVLANLTEHRATIYPGVPALYNAINNFPGVAHMDLSSIKFCISGSAPLLRETKIQFEAISGGKLCEGYGLSETPVATHCNPVLGENRTGSIGLPLPDVDCKVVDIQDGHTELLPGEVGEIIIKGPQVMSGYHNLREELEITLRDGWLYTGDIGKMDEDGYFYLLDRKKEVIKPGGFQVWPREVEEVIQSLEAVLEVAVAGVPDGKGGEAVQAWVVTKSGHSISTEEILAACRNDLAAYKVPYAVEFIETLPRSAVGKVLRRELVREYKEKMA